MNPVTSPDRETSAVARRRRIAARTRLDFWFDAVLLLGFTLAYSYSFTGIGIHEWLGIGLGAALLLHLTLHWDWVIRTTRKLASPADRTTSPGALWARSARATMRGSSWSARAPVRRLAEHVPARRTDR